MLLLFYNYFEPEKMAAALQLIMQDARMLQRRNHQPLAAATPHGMYVLGHIFYPSQ